MLCAVWENVKFNNSNFMPFLLIYQTRKLSSDQYGTVHVLNFIKDFCNVVAVLLYVHSAYAK